MVFLGIVSSTIDQNRKSMKAMTNPKMLSIFMERSNDLLTKVQTLSLSWLKTNTFKKSDKNITPNWLSMEYVAVSRMYRHMFLDLTCIGNCDLKDLDDDMIFFMCAVDAIHCLVPLIMTDVTNNDIIHQTREAIKHMLSCIDLQDGSLDDVRIWHIKPNFISALNLPENMIVFGPLILYWEGGLRGEKAIQELKALLYRVSSDNGWKKCALNNLLQQRTIEWLISVLMDEMEQDSVKRKINRNARVHVYKNITEIQQKLNEYEPLSIVFLNTDSDLNPTNEEMYAMLYHSHGGDYGVIPLNFTNYEEICGSHYFEIHLENQSFLMEVNQGRSTIEELIDKSLVAVPSYSYNNNYIILSQEWKELKKVNGELLFMRPTHWVELINEMKCRVGS